MTFIPGDWTTVETWCAPPSLDWGVCWWAMCGNKEVLETGQRMPDVEIMSAARAMEGLNPYDRSTDHGELMEVGFRYLMTEGWPGDPTLKPVSWRRTATVEEAIAEAGSAEVALMLPSLDGGWCFTDEAVAAGVQGTGGHAVLAVCADPDWVTFITWGAPQRVSRAWWSRYCVATYAVVHPAYLARVVASNQQVQRVVEI